MQISTFNVNSIKARLAYVVHWLQARQPDVVCLQELKVQNDKFPHDAFAELGYQAHVHGQKQWNGVAVLTREPGEVLQVGLPGAEDAGARFLTVATGGLQVSSVYVPNGKTLEHPDFERKLRFMQSLTDHLRNSAGHDAIVGGDFNIVPGDRDSHAPDALRGSIFHTDAERRAITEFTSLGFVDLYRHLNPDGDMFSWWDYRGGSFYKNRGLRIDFLFASPNVTSRCRRAWVDRDYRKKKDGQTASDHAPVFAELEPA